MPSTWLLYIIIIIKFPSLQHVKYMLHTVPARLRSSHSFNRIVPICQLFSLHPTLSLGFFSWGRRGSALQDQQERCLPNSCEVRSCSVWARWAAEKWARGCSMVLSRTWRTNQKPRKLSLTPMKFGISYTFCLFLLVDRAPTPTSYFLASKLGWTCKTSLVKLQP